MVAEELLIEGGSMPPNLELPTWVQRQVVACLKAFFHEEGFDVLPLKKELARNALDFLVATKSQMPLKVLIVRLTAGGRVSITSMTKVGRDETLRKKLRYACKHLPTRVQWMGNCLLRVTCPGEHWSRDYLPAELHALYPRHEQKRRSHA